MSLESFVSLVSAIEDHHFFYNNSNHAQAPVKWQLLVALSHLGLSGNGGLPLVIGQLFNICEGSVENYMNRCILAIIDKLEEQQVYWPSPEARAISCSERQGRTVFNQCVGFVDGTIFPLASAPTKHKEDYWMRKMVYAVNSMFVCDSSKRIIYAVHGWCGSAHDQRVFKNSQLCIQPTNFFSQGEYILADSAYTALATVVPAFKRSGGQSLPEPKQRFNKAKSTTSYRRAYNWDAKKLLAVP
ncbi:hypothetical protein PTTG_02242 [Puccinia triticina 1-1 BBBD Race 1]|uniref:DDE Tnp4 domain-containing protein n=1 Tax=Puccinia triticina (isolate 1-1 / race 1 (BBBD)) TaxID=630390 RepID=A0A180GIG6_PUCT1|nr:hypothetical protein PTTG_02242 [Puccinia triticina 1-1 BBBD Race 1]